MKNRIEFELKYRLDTVSQIEVIVIIGQVFQTDIKKESEMKTKFKVTQHNFLNCKQHCIETRKKKMVKNDIKMKLN